MHTTLLRAAALVTVAAALPLAVFAAVKPFSGPSGWDHAVVATSTPTLPRAQETWKHSDEQMTYMYDGGLSFDDSVAAVKKNIADNGMTSAMQKDRSCAGQRALEVDMTLGSVVVHQIIVDDTPGVTKLTYVRNSGAAFSPDVKSTLAAYCGA